MTTESQSKRMIQEKRRGTHFGFWLFRMCLRFLGLRPAYFFLIFPCGYYILFDADARAKAMPYIRRRFPEYGRVRQFLAMYKLFVSQGKILIDRHCMVHCPDMFKSEFHGYDEIKDMVENSEEGFILLMSHSGNWQAVLSAIEYLRRPVCLLMRPEDNPAVAEAMSMKDGDNPVTIVSPEQFLGGVVELMKLLQKGYLVSIMGDRCYDFNSINVNYLGENAAFPYGAFTIAAAAECPVLVLLSSKRDTHHYDVKVGKIFNPKYEDRRNKNASLRKWVQEYADVLERFAEKHPFQCFLFHDVWKEAEENQKPAT